MNCFKFEKNKIKSDQLLKLIGTVSLFKCWFYILDKNSKSITSIYLE